MTLTTLIQEAQDLLDKYGDIEVVMAEDHRMTVHARPARLLRLGQWKEHGGRDRAVLEA